MPHKMVMAPIVQLPFGPGRALPEQRLAVARGRRVDEWRWSRWCRAAFRSRSRQTPNTTNLNGAGQRPNLVPGADVLAPATSRERLENNHGRQSVSEPGGLLARPGIHARQRAVRFSPGVRSPVRTSVDLAINKDFPTGGTSKRDAAPRGDQPLQHAVVHADGEHQRSAAPTSRR